MAIFLLQNLKKYLLAESLITITEEGWFSSGQDQANSNYPVLAK
ncbi:MAG: hypothetical protein O4751_09940 [Trichodesmium sp. St2_bin6]|nr:hypothetical protein [Trichodesmium sp. St5_bin8]MDE5078562.1 hypothetical protein [Trichodesmium sp. St2_bin6]MDE5091006.1 hypothetical protein [Trichodesmium sp. St18_bin3_1_1]MDE5105236.1 hypothetical protein [Trichodesmium sp. St19_bin2]